MGEGALKEYEELRATLNSVLGMSEAEQRVQQQRQRAMEEVERDREGHRAAREASWSRPEGETTEEEFRCLLKGLYVLSPLDLAVSRHNAHTFCSLNGVPSDALGDGGSVLIVHLDEAILDHRRLQNSKESSVRHVADDFEHVVRRLAKEYFFYSDLCEHDQPHVLYYREDDDGRSLTDYNFGKDALAESSRKRASDKERDGSRRKFYRERTLRYRVASERYQALAKGEMTLDWKLAKEHQRLRHELDRTASVDLSASLKALRRACKDSDAVFVISDDHLSIALARMVVLDLAGQIPSHHVYSTTKFDAEWIIKEIRACTKSKHSYRVLGQSSRLERAAERALHNCHQRQFVRVKQLRDLEF